MCIPPIIGQIPKIILVRGSINAFNTTTPKYAMIVDGKIELPKRGFVIIVLWLRLKKAIIKVIS